MRVAIVHDWLTNQGGAEKVVLALHELFPKAPIYTSVYKKSAFPEFKDADIRTTFLQKIPSRLKYRHQLWSVLRPLAFRSLDLSDFDVVISVSTAESKQVQVGKKAVHICYCNTPIRYYWVQYERYKKDPGLGILNPLAKLLLPVLVGHLRKGDFKAAQKVDHFLANSTEVQARIKKYYKRDSSVVFPPVDTAKFTPERRAKRSGYLVVGRLIPYKRVDLAVRACTELNVPLTVVGTGPEYEKLRRIAGPKVSFQGFVPDDELPKYFQTAKAFIFSAEEDFGIVAVEAMAAGCPVVAFEKGGSRDTVIEGKTGVLFEKQTVSSLKKALRRFETKKFKTQDIIEHSYKFDVEEFKLEMSELVRQANVHIENHLTS